MLTKLSIEIEKADYGYYHLIVEKTFKIQHAIVEFNYEGERKYYRVNSNWDKQFYNLKEAAQAEALAYFVKKL